MRPIAPLDVSGLVPADLAGQRQPDFDLVNPRELWVDDLYQRDFVTRSRRLAVHIVTAFDWASFVPPTCVRVDGQLHVINGQTTATACASHPEISVIPVIIVDAPKVSQRARAFVNHSRDRVAATPGQVWHGLVAAGDEAALTIADVCRRADVELLPFSPERSNFKPGQTIALAAIRRLIERRGAERAGEVLAAYRRTDHAPLSADMIKVFDALMCDPDYAGDIDPQGIVDVLLTLGAKAQDEARTLAITRHLPMWRALIAVVLKHRKARPKPAEAAHIPAGISEYPSTDIQLPDPVAPRLATAQPRTSVPAKPLSAQARVIDRRPVAGPVPMGEPGPGRSALDQRRALS